MFQSKDRLAEWILFFKTQVQAVFFRKISCGLSVFIGKQPNYMSKGNFEKKLATILPNIIMFFCFLPILVQVVAYFHHTIPCPPTPTWSSDTLNWLSTPPRQTDILCLLLLVQAPPSPPWGLTHVDLHTCSHALCLLVGFGQCGGHQPELIKREESKVGAFIYIPLLGLP